MNRIYEKLSDWLIPALLAAAVTALGAITKELSGLNTTLAVAVSRIQEHDHRLDKQALRMDKIEDLISRVKR